MSDIEKIILPSDYDISRVQMTGTRYQLRKHGWLTTLKEHFRDLVRGGRSPNEIRIASFDFLELRRKVEARIIYFQEKDFRGCTGTAEKILRIVTSKKYRAGNIHIIKLEKYTPHFLAVLQDQVDKNEPVQFMLPAFPFKIKNPLKSSRGDADLAEVASFLRFNEINLQIKAVYAPGAQFFIFHDGHLYFRHFLHEQRDADRYFASLKRFIQELHLGDAIVLWDALEELKKFDEFPHVYETARAEMQNLWDVAKDTNKHILTIRASADDNINLSDIDEDMLFQISVRPDIELDPEAKRVKAEIAERADRCAFKYMVVQHAIEKLHFFDRAVPHGVRMTVHPKEGQIGVCLVKKTTFLLPWMGVGVMKKNGELSIRYEHEMKYSSHFAPVFIGEDRSPFYYEER